MADITLKGNPFHTAGELPAAGDTVEDFTLINVKLEPVSKSSLSGSKLVLNCFPSIDTPVCATSVKKFNEEAASLEGVKVLCISKDLPFALKRFCGGEGLDNVIPLSAFRDTDLTHKLGLEITDGPLAGLFARAVVVLDDSGKVLYSQLVTEVAEEPDYAQALSALKS